MDTPYSLVALLPMKGHSERVTGKNFRPFHGKPLFSWILSALLELDVVQRVIINTDARSLLAAYPELQHDRVLIRDRKPEICGDFVSMNRVIADDINNVPADIYLMTHATNPLLRSQTIQAALDTFVAAKANGTADSLFTVNKFQTRFYRADGSAVNHNPEKLERTQDLEPWFEENSNLYIFTRESFHATQARIGQRPLLFETPRVESLDIDDQAGWEMAELLAGALWAAG